MHLTKGEFCRFNLKSRMNLLKTNGILLMEKKIGNTLYIKLFLIYDFYVEVFLTQNKKEVIKAEPLWNKGLLKFYLFH